MKQGTESPEDHIGALPEAHREPMRRLRETILAHLPGGFEERVEQGMIGYVVPHALYPPGYHGDPGQPLPFFGLASRKGHLALHHLGIYADRELMAWFVAEYPRLAGRKPDVGKSCIRFRDPGTIPLELIGELVGKMGVARWIELYERRVKR